MLNFFRPRPRRNLVAQKPAAIVENIEPRVMLDGNVTASLVNGHLKLIGDADGNDLTVTIDTDGTVAFSANSTTVNGNVAANEVLAGTVNSIAVAMGAGADSLQIRGPVAVAANASPFAVLSGDVTVRLGDGADSFTLRGVQVEGRIYAGGEGDNDVMTVEGIGAEGEVIVAGNRNDDRIAIRQVVGSSDVFARGGGETDRFTVGQNVVAGPNNQFVLDNATRNETETELKYPDDPADPAAETDEELAAREAVAADVNNEFVQNPHQSSPTDVFDAWVAQFEQVDPSTISFTPSTAFPSDFLDYDASEFTLHSSGLYYRIIDPGTGEFPTENSTVEVNYQGVLTSDGTQFDSSFDRGQSSSFSLQGVIDGWTEGVPLVATGGKIQLLLPPNLAYGSTGSGNIPADATLFFNVDVISIS